MNHMKSLKNIRLPPSQCPFVLTAALIVHYYLTIIIPLLFDHLILFGTRSAQSEHRPLPNDDNILQPFESI